MAGDETKGGVGSNVSGIENCWLGILGTSGLLWNKIVVVLDMGIAGSEGQTSSKHTHTHTHTHSSIEG